MNASSPNPRYFKDANGLRPNWRFKLRHPRAFLRMKLLWRVRSLKDLLRARYGRRRIDRIARALTAPELAYLSRAIFRQRIDKPEDAPEIAASLDPLISVARMGAQRLQRARERQ